MITTFYVYVLISSIDQQPFYVGKGKGTRMYQHLREATRLSNKKRRSVHCKIINILSQDGRLQYAVTPCTSEQHAFNTEKQLILKWGRKDNHTGILHNLTDGGEGSTNLNIDNIKKRAEKHRGMKRSAESRQLMSECQLKVKAELKALYKGKACSPETSARMSKSRKGKPWSENKRASKTLDPRAKSVLVYAKNTNDFIGEWDSISACAKELKCDCTAIWKICRGDNSTPAPNGKSYSMKSHKGYVFKYKD